MASGTHGEAIEADGAGIDASLTVASPLEADLSAGGEEMSTLPARRGALLAGCCRRFERGFVYNYDDR